MITIQEISYIVKIFLENLLFFGFFMDWITVIKIAEETITKQGIDKAKLSDILGVNSQYLTDIRTKKKKSPGPEFVLSLIIKLNFNPLWLTTGEGPIFNPPPPEKLSLGTIIDQRIETIEARIAQNIEHIETRLAVLEAGPREKDPDSTLFVSEPEPKYDTVRVCSVDNVAAGAPIPQSEDLSNYVEVPKRLIKTNPEDYYAAHIRGESMFAAGIPDGCWALIRKSDVPRNGAIQVVRCGERSTLKRLREHEDCRWTLNYEDGTNRFIEFGPDEDYQIQGDFIAVLPDVK